MLGAIHEALAAWVASGTASVIKYQRLCGVTAEGPTNALLHPIFAIGSSLGNELFFLTFFPIVISADFEIARRTMVCWAAIYYIGQVLKDALQLPRPPVRAKISASHTCAACPAACGGAWCSGRGTKFQAGPMPSAASTSPAAAAAARSKGVVCLESHYAAEFGMPSTHAMCSVGLPWSLVAWAAESGRCSPDVLPPLVAFATFYTFATTLSRPYMGVHSPADLLVGLVLGALILLADLRLGKAVDLWVLHSPLAPAALPLLLVALMAAYPRPHKWKSSPGDTMLVMASTTGVLLAATLESREHLAASSAQRITLPAFPTPLTCLNALLRLLAAGAACAATRALLKPVCVALLEAALGPVWGDAEEISASARVGDTPVHLLQAAGVQAAAASSHADAATGRSSSTQWGAAAAASTAASASQGSAGGSGARAEAGAAEGGGGVHKRHSSSSSSSGSGGEGGSSAGGAAATAAEGGPEAAEASAVEKGGSSQGGASGALPPKLSLDTLRIRAPADKVRVPPEQRYAIELPTKAVVYGAVGIVVTYVVPRLFRALGI